jgi:Flp pilus assembly protein TadD
VKRAAAALALAAFLPALLAAAAPGKAAVPAAVVVPDVDPLRLTPKMAQFLVKEVGGRQGRALRLNALINAIFSKDGLDITYGETATRTAIETFKERDGNCLSFTFLFVAMARHLGFSAYFTEVDEVLSWDQRGEILVVHKHMFATVEMDNGTVRVDFLPGAEKRYRDIRRISDSRAVAHYYNNLGADLLTAGDAAGALPYLDKALERDRSLTLALVNRGVAYRQLGDFAAAEECYRQALEVDKGEASAASNLASLYLSQGRVEEAQPLLRRVHNHLKRNPFHYFRQGVLAAERGHSEAAIKHLRQAIDRMPGESGFHAALADAYLQAGDLEEARKSLRRALRAAKGAQQRSQMEARLAGLPEPQ